MIMLMNTCQVLRKVVSKNTIFFLTLKKNGPLLLINLYANESMENVNNL